MAKTLYDKLWDSHVVTDYGSGECLIYIDRQLLHEVSSPQAFAGIRQRSTVQQSTVQRGTFQHPAKASGVHRPATQMAVADHAVPTREQSQPIADPLARAQVALLIDNVTQTHIPYIPIADARHGIVHIIGPEQGFTQPGISLVCGDSHTSTHGAFGALAFGIGASECECVLATQTLRQARAKNFSIEINGVLSPGVSAKDIILTVIGKIGSGGATGYALEFSGDTVRQMSMAARMTLCNMAIEAGSRTGLVAPDAVTFAYLAGRPQAPKGVQWDAAIQYWRGLASDSDAQFDKKLVLDAAHILPQVTWGTSPDQVLAITQFVPDPADPALTDAARQKLTNALHYMGLTPGMAMQDIAIDYVFIGSCTNSRIEDLRAAAAVLKGKKIANTVKAIVVPGSGLVKAQAEAEGLDKLFLQAGFEWRSPGCSLCVAMNDDRLPTGTRCASTSNRNFEGRQGAGARTHLMSPAMAAAAAIAGRLVDVRDFLRAADARDVEG